MFFQSFDMAPSDFFKIEYRRNFNYPQHLHVCYELIILLDGEMKVNIDNTEYILKKHDSVLIFPNQIHLLESTNSKHVLFLFSSKFVQAYTTKKQGTIPKNNKFSLSQNIVKMLTSLNENSSIFEIKGALYTICGIFDREKTYKSAYMDKDNLLVKIFKFVEENFKGDCSLSNLSKTIGYEYTYLSRHFKHFTGISYNQYVNISRLNYASYLLHNTSISILECSIECGYNSLRSFNRTFKSFYGMTPREYKKKGFLVHGS